MYVLKKENEKVKMFTMRPPSAPQNDMHEDRGVSND